MKKYCFQLIIDKLDENDSQLVKDICIKMNIEYHSKMLLQTNTDKIINSTFWEIKMFLNDNKELDKLLKILKLHLNHIKYKIIV